MGAQFFCSHAEFLEQKIIKNAGQTLRRSELVRVWE